MVLLVTGLNTKMPGSKCPSVQFCRIGLKELPGQTSIIGALSGVWRKTGLDVQIMLAARPCPSATWCTKSNRVELRSTGPRGSPIRTFRASHCLRSNAKFESEGTEKLRMPECVSDADCHEHTGEVPHLISSKAPSGDVTSTN